MKIKWKDIILVISVALATIVLAGGAAYFSVFGLSKLFAGATFGLIIFAGIELGKIVAISAVYRKWDTLKKKLKYYLSVLIIVSMLITSLGVYSYLINAYQSTKYKMENRDGQIKLMDNKKKLFENELSRFNKNIETSTNRINTITSLRNNQERRLDTLYNRRFNNVAKRTETLISSSDEQIGLLNKTIENNTRETNRINDSISFYDQKILELKGSDVTREIGPLKYISELTGINMDKVVSYLTILIIFLVDPFAIGLLILFNELTLNENNTKDDNNNTDSSKMFRRKKKDEDEVVQEIEETPEEIVQEPVNIKEPEKESVIEPEPQHEDVFGLEQGPPTPNFIYEEPVVDVEEPDVVEEPEPKKNEILSEICPDGYTETKIELNKSDIKEGLKVYHSTFGRGKILKSDIEKNRILIQFDEFGIKEINPYYANLSEIKCVKKDNIEAVKYLDFFEDDPDIQDIIIKKPKIIEETPVETTEELVVEQTPSEEEIIFETPDETTEELVVEQTPPPQEEIIDVQKDEIVVEQPKEDVVIEPKQDEKKTKFFQKIWKGKKII